MNITLNEPIIHSGSKTYRASDRWLKELGETTITNNRNYLTVLRRIPSYFETEDLFLCMSLAFNFGELIGKECERDMIKWNALCTFNNMKIYAQEHNGELPTTFDDLKKWEKEREEYHNQLTESEQSV